MERKGGVERRGNWTDALACLALPDSAIQELAERWTDLVLDAGRNQDRDGMRLILMDLILAVREAVGGGV